MAITPDSIFGEIVYALRRKYNLTQEQLAAKSFYSRDYIYRLEKGERGPGAKTFSRFAPLFEMTAPQLLEIFLKRLRDEGLEEKWIKSD